MQNTELNEKTYRQAEQMWEALMMDLLGEDGPGSVKAAILQLKEQRDELYWMLKEIRSSGAINPAGRLWEKTDRVIALVENPKPIHKLVKSNTDGTD